MFDIPFFALFTHIFSNVFSLLLGGIITILLFFFSSNPVSPEDVKQELLEICSGLLIPDTILGGTMTSTEVFNDKTKKKFYS